MSKIKKILKQVSKILPWKSTTPIAPRVLDFYSLQQTIGHGVHVPEIEVRHALASHPPSSVAFVTIANDKFVPGLEGLLLSMLAIYPRLVCDFHVFHDGTLSDFVQARLKSFYSRLTFEIPDMAWFEDAPSESGNHKRIGKLGFMNVMALRMTRYKRVILLDSDMLIAGDISALWRGGNRKEGDGFVDEGKVWVCHDVGVEAGIVISPKTGKPVINSGVISLPQRYLGEEYFAQARNLTLTTREPYCETLDHFSDQKVWNRFLADKETEFLPLNYNCNVRFLQNFMGGRTDFMRVLHFTGPKPWFTKEFIEDAFVKKENSRATNRVWREFYRRELTEVRIKQYRDYRASHPVRPTSGKRRELKGKAACFFIGNGPSLARTKLEEISKFETFAFNWFVNHPAFDKIKPDNLVLASHMLFGGWGTQAPVLPSAYLDALLSKTWKPKLWTSFYFKPYFDQSGLAEQFEIEYFLFEKPAKYFVDQIGSATLDLDGFLTDGRTGVLSAATPIAASMGFKVLGLVGCDSNYNQQGGSSNYFYSAALHQSASTEEGSLTQTWTPDGRGHCAYQVVQGLLEKRGMTFLDFTLEGALSLPKGDWGQLAHSSSMQSDR